MEAARGQGYEVSEVEDRRKQREERSVPHAETEDDAGIVLGEPQEGGVAYAEDIDTIAEDSAENRVARGTPFVGGSIGSLAVASCSAVWAGKAYHVADDHQAWAFARKACPRNDSSSKETWQRLPQYLDDIGQRKVNSRFGS